MGSQVALVLAIVAIVLAAVDILEARGRAFTSWAVVILAVIVIAQVHGL